MATWGRSGRCVSGRVSTRPTGRSPPMGRRLISLPPTLLHWTQRRAVTPCGPKEAPHRRQRERPSPHAVFLMLSRRTERRLRADGQTDGHKVGTSLTPADPNNNAPSSLKKKTWLDLAMPRRQRRRRVFPPHPMRSCSVLSIMAARASTPLMISFSSSVSSAPGGPQDTLFILYLLCKSQTHRDYKWHAKEKDSSDQQEEEEKEDKEREEGHHDFIRFSEEGHFLI